MRAGDSVELVGLLSFLVGIVLAQQGAVQLRQFGAEVFVINLIGRSTVRELGIRTPSLEEIFVAYLESADSAETSPPARAEAVVR